MTLDLDTFIRIATFVMSVGAMVAAWIATRRKDVDVRFDGLAEKIESQRARIEAAEARLSRVEQQVESMPGRGELHRLELTLTQMAGNLSTISESMNGQREIMKRLENIVTRHEDHLLGDRRS
ncbi:DUF2730 family protein [Meridianimarinicoccus sp. RP-17]|uniref:DUF2730 family protein n=1 Tax=Meridianimarinicoccus zhengii TaxID=2056810 RepID=UPI0013A6DA86|nr:DUF2730 family protein [Phycocomes zhengii]